jgi:hypothetical protein
MGKLSILTKSSQSARDRLHVFRSFLLLLTIAEITAESPKHRSIRISQKAVTAPIKAGADMIPSELHP